MVNVFSSFDNDKCSLFSLLTDEIDNRHNVKYTQPRANICLYLLHSLLTYSCLIPEPVYITRHPHSVTVQAGQEVVLTCEATSFPRPAYQWLKNNIPMQNKCSNELKLKEVREEASGEYMCRVTNPIGSEFSAPAQVQVIPAIAHVGKCRKFLFCHLIVQGSSYSNG